MIMSGGRRLGTDVTNKTKQYIYLSKSLFSGTNSEYTL